MQSDDGTNLTLQMSPVGDIITTTHDHGDKNNSNSAAIPVRCTTELSTAAMTALSQNVQSDHDLRVACYCEENVWRIAYRKLHYQTQHELRLAESNEQNNNNNNNANRTTTAKYVVAFISNRRQCVPMLHQRASSSPSKIPCCWDYHVILLGVNNSQLRDVGTTATKDNNNCVLVYDVDTTLQPYPISLAEYLMATFPNVEEEYSYPEYLPRFRLISAPLFVQYFASDRRHMYNTTTQSWNAPPPTYACIVPPPPCCRSSSSNTSDPTITNTHETTDSIHGKNHEHNEPRHGIGVGPNKSWNSNLKYYLDFQETLVEHQQDLPHDALGSIVTLQQLREYRF
jgi:N-terminal glutamine amidase